MSEWRAATIEEVRQIIARDLQSCDATQRLTFKKYAVKPFCAPIVRYGIAGTVVVVARKRGEVIYWEDIEGGFNISPISADGKILEHWCNQDELRFALNAWIRGRGLWGRRGPAEPLS